MGWDDRERKIMSIFKIVLFGLLMTGVSVEVLSAGSNTLSKKQLQKYIPLKANEGRKLKSLKLAKLGDVHLAKPVKYFDIKYYHSENKAYSGGFSFDMNTWKKLSLKEKKKIQTQHFVHQGESFAVQAILLDGGPILIANLHYIDDNSNAYTFSSRKKLVKFLGTIDTPVELAILLLSERGRVRYKKSDNLYIIRTDLIYEENDGTNKCYQDTGHVIIDKKGDILLEKTITKPHALKKYDALRKKFGR